MGGWASLVGLLLCTSSAVAQDSATAIVYDFRVSYDSDGQLGRTLDTVITLGNGSTADKAIVKMEMWTRRGEGVFGPNIPLKPGQFIQIRMSEVIKGNWNVNPSVQTGEGFCGPSAGWAEFTNPDSVDLSMTGTGIYPSPVWGSYLPMSLATVLRALDAAAPDTSCAGAVQTAPITSPLSGFVTFDVVNYCTSSYPKEEMYFRDDAIATVRPGGRTSNLIWATTALIGSQADIPDFSWWAINLPFDRYNDDWISKPTFYSSYADAVFLNDFYYFGEGIRDQYRWIGDGRLRWTGAPGTIGLLGDRKTVAQGSSLILRALIFPSPAAKACAGYSCLLSLYSRVDGTGGRTLVGSAGVDAFDGVAKWSIPVDLDPGRHEFWVEPGDCRSCPECISLAWDVTVTAVEPAPMLTLTAVPQTITTGQSSTLTWTIANATSARLEVVGQGLELIVAENGSKVVTPNATTTYTLSATGPGGTTTRSVTVTVNPAVPTIEFTANPATITAGQASTLTWTIANATSATIDQNVGTAALPTGSRAVTPTVPTVYTLTATGPGGTASKTAPVTVNAACAVPSGPTSPLVRPRYNPVGPVTGTDPLRVSWGAPAGGTTPTAYEYRLNGDPYKRVGTSLLEDVAARGSNGGQAIQLFVRAVACSSELLSGPVSSPAYPLSPPSADFQVASEVAVLQPVIFTDRSDQATSWLWLVDDGGSPGVQQAFTHTFQTTGTHTVALLASNGNGTSLKTRTISVRPTSSAVATATRTRAFVAVEAERQRLGGVNLEVEGPALLRLTAKGSGKTVCFVKLLGAEGELEQERRLVVSGGVPAVYDAKAWAAGGKRDLELVCGGEVTAELEQPAREERGPYLPW